MNEQLYLEEGHSEGPRLETAVAMKKLHGHRSSLTRFEMRARLDGFLLHLLQNFPDVLTPIRLALAVKHRPALRPTLADVTAAALNRSEVGDFTQRQLGDLLLEAWRISETGRDQQRAEPGTAAHVQTPDDPTSWEPLSDAMDKRDGYLAQGLFVAKSSLVDFLATSPMGQSADCMRLVDAFPWFITPDLLVALWLGACAADSQPLRDLITSDQQGLLPDVLLESIRLSQGHGNLWSHLDAETIGQIFETMQGNEVCREVRDFWGQRTAKLDCRVTSHASGFPPKILLQWARDWRVGTLVGAELAEILNAAVNPTNLEACQLKHHQAVLLEFMHRVDRLEEEVTPEALVALLPPSEAESVLRHFSVLLHSYCQTIKDSPDLVRRTHSAMRMVWEAHWVT